MLGRTGDVLPGTLSIRLPVASDLVRVLAAEARGRRTWRTCLAAARIASASASRLAGRLSVRCLCHACRMPDFGIDLADWFVSNAGQVDRDLTRYFGEGKDKFTGRWFEEFAAIGDPNPIRSIRRPRSRSAIC